MTLPPELQARMAALTRKAHADTGLVEALREGRRAIGDHFAPNDWPPGR